MNGTLNIVLFLRKGLKFPLVISKAKFFLAYLFFHISSLGHGPQILGELFFPYLRIFLSLVKQWISIETPCLSHRLCVYPSPQAHSFGLGTPSTVCCNMG